MNLKVGGQPQNIPTTPGKVSQQQNKTISGSAAELNAARMIALAEGGRTATVGAGLTSAAGGLQSGFSVTQGGATAGTSVNVANEFDRKRWRLPIQKS